MPADEQSRRDSLGEGGVLVEITESGGGNGAHFVQPNGPTPATTGPLDGDANAGPAVTPKVLVDADGKPIAASYFNQPMTKHYVMNSRGERVHLRYYLPEPPQTLRAVVFFFHGYGAHVNSPSPHRLGEVLAREGLAVVMHDYSGHGYSEGERAYIKDYRWWADDCVQIITTVMTGCQVEAGKGHFAIPEEVCARLQQVPFFVSGQSLGGGLAILVGRRLTGGAAGGPRAPPEVAKRFKGAALMCPAIKGNAPPWPVVMALRWLVAPIAPLRQLPSFLETVHQPDLIWTKEEDFYRATLDHWGKPGGLGWGRNMRFGTGVQLLEMVEDIETHVQEVSFPFLVQHDPQDGIIRFEGTRMLLDNASTPDNVHRGKDLREMHGGKHDLLSNVREEVIANLLGWIQDRLTAES